MTTLPPSEVKARLSEIAEGVAATHERVQITKNGRDHVVLLAATEEIERGDVLDETQVRALLAARRSGSTE
jgi:prevent-host-death family protein